MELLDSLTIINGTEKRSIEIWQGDITEMSPAEAVNILISDSHLTEVAMPLVSISTPANKKPAIRNMTFS